MQEYIINSPTVIQLTEKCIVENCSVEINAPVTVYGKLVFRNCSMNCITGGITVYGQLTIDLCQTFVEPKFLTIKDGGLYLAKLMVFNDGTLDLSEGITLEKNGRFGFAPCRLSSETILDNAIFSCVSKHYDMDKDTICSGKGAENFSEQQRTAWREARKVAIYLRRTLRNAAFYEIRDFNYPTYLVGDIWDETENYIKCGDDTLWRSIAEINSEIVKMLYNAALEDENAYPYRD